MNNDMTMEAMMKKLGNDNPKLQMIAQMMAQQKQAPDDETSHEKILGQNRKLKKINMDLKQKLLSINKQRKQILQYLDYFIEVNSSFSSAVGACECWGGDPECPRCEGKGHPGHFEVDDQQFSIYVKPVLSVKEKVDLTRKPEAVLS